MYTESAFKKGNCSVMSKREDPIGIVLIYWVVVKKPGEGDKSLAYWRQVHEEVFTGWMSEAGLTFTPDSKVVLEEFSKVYPL